MYAGTFTTTRRRRRRQPSSAVLASTLSHPRRPFDKTRNAPLLAADARAPLPRITITLCTRTTKDGWLLKVAMLVRIGPSGVGLRGEEGVLRKHQNHSDSDSLVHVRTVWDRPSTGYVDYTLESDRIVSGRYQVCVVALSGC